MTNFHNSNAELGLDGWVSNSPNTFGLGTHPYWYNNTKNFFKLNPSGTGTNDETYMVSRTITVKPNTMYHLHFFWIATYDISGIDVYFIESESGILTSKWKPTSDHGVYDKDFSSGSNTSMQIRIEINGSTDANMNAFIGIAEICLTEGVGTVPWSAASADSATVTAFNSIKSTVDGTVQSIGSINGQLTTIDNSIKGIQDTVKGKASQTQVTQLADQFTVVSGSISNPNLVLNSGLPTDTSSWLNAGNLSIGKHAFYRNNRANAFYINNATTAEKTASTNRFKVTQGQSYTVSFKAFASYNSVNQDVFFLGRSASSTASSGYDKVMLLVDRHRYSPTRVESAKVTFTVPDDIDEGYLRFDNNGSTDGNNSVFYFTEIKVEAGTLATPWEAESSYAQLTVMQGLIDQRVMVDGKITAALSLSADGGGTVTIRGASLYVTADSHFDAASIQSAAIAGLAAEKITTGSISADRLATTKLNADNITSGSIAAERLAATKISATNIIGGTFDAGTMTVKHLSADMIATGTLDVSKLTAVKNFSASNIIGGTLDASTMTVKKLSASSITGGTLNAANVSVIGLNASAISAGTITGANLAINLNTGMVTFQSGRIHSTTDNIDINIDKGYMSVADSTSRVLLKGGQLQFVQPQLFDLQTTPYLSISNDGVGSNWAGATIVGRDSIMLANSANTGDSTTTWEIGQNTFSGLISGKNSDGTWEPTILGGAERGVVIVGGTLSDNPIADSSPFIRVGASTDGQSVGNRIYMRAAYIIAPAIYSKTTGSSSNVVVLNDGSLHRSTSASKYKTMIERSRSTSMAEALLSLPTAHWLDKAELSHYASGEQKQAPTPYFGMIAEDLAAAGLEDLVQRGDTGELEGINYDRIAPALLPLLAKMKQEIEELKSAAKSA